MCEEKNLQAVECGGYQSSGHVQYEVIWNYYAIYKFLESFSLSNLSDIKNSKHSRNFTFLCPAIPIFLFPLCKSFVLGILILNFT